MEEVKQLVAGRRRPLVAINLVAICLFVYVTRSQYGVDHSQHSFREGRRLLGPASSSHGLPLQNFGSSGVDHPDVDTPFEWNGRTIGALVAAALCALLANSAGIGGGPFYVPLFNTVLGFDLKLCTALSHATVATSAIASTAYGLWQRRPNDPSRPLVDFDLALLFVPALLFGVSFGVLFNALFPSWLQTVLLTILLVFVTYKTTKKGINQWHKEQKELEKNSGLHPDTIPETDPLLAEADHTLSNLDHEHAVRSRRLASNDDHGVLEHISSAHYHTKDLPAEVLEGMEHGCAAFLQRLPTVHLLEVVGLWLVFLALELQKSGRDRCSWGYFAFYALQSAILLAMTVAFVLHQSRKAQCNAPDMDPEVKKILSSASGGSPLWRLAGVCAIVAVSGAMAGLLGIGGALIFNPFLLAMGVDPQVCASTSVLMILFSSSSIALSYYFNHMLNVSYMAVFAPVACVSSLIGVNLIGYLVRRSGRSSIIILILSSVIAAGTISTAVFGGLQAWEDVTQGGKVGFGAFCAID